jgi:hypothetical protein
MLAMVWGLAFPAAASAAFGDPAYSGSVSDAVNLSVATATAVSGNFAYTTADGMGRLTAVNISNLSTPVVAGNTGFASSLLNASTINISGHYAYVASKNRNASMSSNSDGSGNSLTIVNISTAGSPTIVGTLTDAVNLFGAYGVAVSGNYAYVAAQGCLSAQPCPNGTAGNSFNVIDVSTPGSPHIVGSLHNSSLPSLWAGTNALDHADSVAVSGNYAYVTASYSNRLTVIDISNPTSPTIVASLTDPSIKFPVDVAVSGTHAYVADQIGVGSVGFTVVDISNPLSPRVVGTLNNPYLAGAYRVRLHGNFAYVSASSANAVAMIDISDPTSPRLVFGLSDATHFWQTTGLDLGSTASNLVVTSPFLQGQSLPLYPPFPNQTGGPTETGTVSVINLIPNPIATRIRPSSEPPHITGQSTANFVFDTNDTVSSMRCQLDTGPMGLCTSPATADYSGLTTGTHTFTVVASDSAGNASTPATYSWTIANAPATISPPTITGSAVSGQTLTAAPGTWSGSPAPTFAYAWQRCDATGASCSSIAGATSTTYILTAADVGSKLLVVVTATNSGGSGVASSSATGLVARPSVSRRPPLAHISKVSAHKTRRRYVVKFRLDRSATIVITVRRVRAHHRGVTIERVTIRARKGSNQFTLKQLTRGSTYTVALATTHGTSKSTTITAS